MCAGDEEHVLRIYGEGIATGHATFEGTVPSWEAWDRGHLEACRLVASHDGSVIGWAALSATSQRPVYRGVAELSIYISALARGRGVGDALLATLITSSEAEGIWSLQAGVFPENAASLRLHERHGFRRVGVRERIGKMPFGPMAGQWRDVVVLQRRSACVGID